MKEKLKKKKKDIGEGREKKKEESLDKQIIMY